MKGERWPNSTVQDTEWPGEVGQRGPSGRNGRETRGNSKKLKKRVCRRDVKKFSFPYRSVAVWNRLKEETVCAKTIHEFNSKMGIERYGDGTPRA